MAGGNTKEPETPGTVEDGCDTGARDVVLDIAGITPGSSPASVPGSTHAVATMARTTSSSPNRRIRIPPRCHRHSSVDSTRVLWAHCGIYRTTNPGLAAAYIGRPTLGIRLCRAASVLWAHCGIYRTTNPGYGAYAGRVPRAAPFGVEVGGIEPPSRETSAPASPSAANSELSEHEDSVGKHPHALSGIVFPHRSRNPGGGIPHCNAPTCRGGYPTGGQERLSTLPVRNYRLHLYMFRLFNEDSGDLGSLPAPQLSRSKPCHPRVAGT